MGLRRIARQWSQKNKFKNLNNMIDADRISAAICYVAQRAGGLI